MFGELGKDDKGWGLTTLGECCELNPKRPRNINDELLVSFVPMPAVSEDGKIDCSDIKPYKEVRKGFTYFAENDVLFAKITPCMENGKGAVAKGLEGGIGSGSTEFHVLRPIPGKSNPYWLYILTMFESFRVGARKVMTGTGGQLRVPIGYLNDYPISLPPIDLQERFEEIVHQSDKSKFVRFKSQFIEMFGEDGEKGNCVTKTLQELIDMKWITYHLDGNHGGDYPRADEFVEAGIPYISANGIVGDRIDMKLAKYVTAERAKRFRKGIAENGDVLFAHNATVGPVAILETEEPTVILGTSLTSYRCNSNHILAEYLMAYMKNPLFVQQYERNMQQSTRKQVPITTQRKYSFIIPSMDEQKEFAHFVKQSDKSKLKEEDHKSGMHEL